MPHTIAQRIRQWARDLPSPPFLSIESLIEYLTEQLYSQYEPTLSPACPQFSFRLRDWLNSTPDEEDQKLMFQLVPHIFFIGNREYEALYRTAFNNHVAWWLIDQLGLRLDQPDSHERLKAAVHETWFCPITDSMQIAKYCHINNIGGSDIRPDWRTLEAFGSADRVIQYMADNGLRRIVLLEDFVGTGTQMSDAVEFAASLSTHCPILLCPLVICPKGLETGNHLQSSFSHLRFAPVLTLHEADFIAELATPDEELLFTRLRAMVIKLYPQVAGSMPKNLYGPFGYEGTGALVVMHTNCPDNTLPIVHHKSDAPWTPLFPRSSRL